MARQNTVQDKGRKRLQDHFRKLENRFSILVGVQGKEAQAAHQEGGGELTVGEIASIHELGLGVPERSWLRAWVDENRPMIERDLRNAGRKMVQGKLTPEQAGQLLGVKWVAAIQKRIVEGIEPPNSPVTIARKESSTPLIDTGQLKSAITFLVEKLAARMGSKS